MDELRLVNENLVLEVGEVKNNHDFIKEKLSKHPPFTMNFMR